MAKTSQMCCHSEYYWVKTIRDIDAEAYELGMIPQTNILQD